MIRVRPFVRALLPEFLYARLRTVRAKLILTGNHYTLQRSLGDRPAWRDTLSALRVFLKCGKTILFFPERSQVRFAAYDQCVFLGHTITKNPVARFDVAVKRKNSTFCDVKTLDRIPMERERVINAASLDISKRRVGRVFEEVFGYSLTVNPICYEGAIVEKSNLNGLHDGRMVQGPLVAEDVRVDCVYQKEVVSRSGREGYLLDCRVPVHGDQIPLVYLKYRPEQNRFKEFTGTEFKEPEAVFSKAEMSLLLEMARKMGLDCGDLDVLRHKLAIKCYPKSLQTITNALYLNVL
jgi:hypothetical protein